MLACEPHFLGAVYLWLESDVARRQFKAFFNVIPNVRSSRPNDRPGSGTPPRRFPSPAGRRRSRVGAIDSVDRFGDGSGCARGSPSARLARTIDEHVRRGTCGGGAAERMSAEPARELGAAPVTRRSRARDGASMGARDSAGHETFSCIRRHVELTPRPALLPYLRSHVSSLWFLAKRASVSSVASVTSFLKVSSQTKRADGGEGSN